MVEFCVVYENIFSNKFLLLNKIITKNRDVFVKILKKQQKNVMVFALIKQSINNGKIVNFLKDYIANIILNTYKRDFFIKSLNLNKNDLKHQMLTTALTNYDIVNEKQEIKNLLNFNQDLVLKSFCYFKLKNLTAKWQEMCKLTLENQDIIQDDKVFVNLIKFLKSKGESKINCLSINLLSSNLAEVLIKDKIKLNFKLNDLLKYIVVKNPKNIIITNNLETNHYSKINLLKKLIN